MSVDIKSYTQQVVEDFVEAGAKRLDGLSLQDLSSVIFWLETKQMELAMQMTDEDDALQGARLRGGHWTLGAAAQELMTTIKTRLAETGNTEEEQDE